MKHGLDTDDLDQAPATALLHERTTQEIIGAAFAVYKVLGYGFPEKVYQRAMQAELLQRGVPAEIEHRITVMYKGVNVGDYPADLFRGRKSRGRTESSVRV